MKKTLISGCTVIVILGYAISVFAHSTGMTGVTRKNGNGCDCHGSTPFANVIVTITGPDTLITGQTADYTLALQGGPAVRGGVDIAASSGNLNPISASLQKIDGELTHISPVQFDGPVLTFQFSYTAPSAPGQQTIFANGNSVNFNGASTGDQWNFAPDKNIVVRQSVTTVERTAQSLPKGFFLSQNYPNPFNPCTSFDLRVAEPKAHAPLAQSYQFVSVKVYDVLGKEITTLMNEEKSPG
ncbi:MAG: hypothetical protein HY089_10230, partial [Ignavibacteriales bacterium]|nr:hypothetical protein [Ignavibacteriales bacterium]